MNISFSDQDVLKVIFMEALRQLGGTMRYTNRTMGNKAGFAVVTYPDDTDQDTMVLQLIEPKSNIGANN